MESTKLGKIIRWIILLPAAIGGSAIIYFAFYYFNRIGLSILLLDPDSFFLSIYYEFFSNALAGAALVYIANYAAPTFKKRVILTIASTYFIISLISIYYNLTVSNYWRIFQTISTNVGSIYLAYYIYKDSKTLAIDS